MKCRYGIMGYIRNYRLATSFCNHGSFMISKKVTNAYKTHMHIHTLYVYMCVIMHIHIYNCRSSCN